MAFLTRLEELFMLAVFHQNGPACLMDIRKYLLDKTGNDWAIASPYIALDKLKRKGVIKSFKGNPKHVRGGKAPGTILLLKKGFGSWSSPGRCRRALGKILSLLQPGAIGPMNKKSLPPRKALNLLLGFMVQEEQDSFKEYTSSGYREVLSTKGRKSARYPV